MTDKQQQNDMELARSLGLLDAGVEMEVRRSPQSEWQRRKVISAYQNAHGIVWRSEDNDWEYARPIPAKRMRPMTHAEIFKAIWEGAVVRSRLDKRYMFNAWNTNVEQSEYEICRHYTGTDADVWQKMEVEE